MRGLIFGLVTLGLLAALFVYFKPEPAAVPLPGIAAPSGVAQPSRAADTASIATDTLAAPQKATFRLQIQQGRLIDSPAVLRVPVGTPVRLQVISDQPDELHLHGYDLSLPLPAHQHVELRFVAERSGRFEYELHRAHQDLGALEVLPR